MAEQKYKIDTKSELTKVAEDLQKVLGARAPTPAASPAKGGGQPKTPSQGESVSEKPEEKPSA